jgi:hypothetical protein
LSIVDVSFIENLPSPVLLLKLNHDNYPDTGGKHRLQMTLWCFAVPCRLSTVRVNKMTASYYFQRLLQIIYDNSEHLELLGGEVEAKAKAEG